MTDINVHLGSRWAEYVHFALESHPTILSVTACRLVAGGIDATGQAYDPLDAFKNAKMVRARLGAWTRGENV